MITQLLFLAVTASTSLCFAQSELPTAPEANPGRPTVSTPATLTPTGYLQFETGILGANQSLQFSSRFGIEEVIKLSVAPRLELLVSDEPISHYTANGASANAVGDAFIGAQGVLRKGQGTKPTISLSYFRHVYSGAAPDLDVGTPTNSFLILASADVKGFHYDANAVFNEISAKVRRAQFGQSLSVSHKLVGKLSLTGEVWNFTQPLIRGRAIGNLWALGYETRQDLVLDAGFNRGLTGTSTQWEEFIGFTYLLPRRLWKTSR